MQRSNDRLRKNDPAPRLGDLLSRPRALAALTFAAATLLTVALALAQPAAPPTAQAPATPAAAPQVHPGAFQTGPGYIWFEGEDCVAQTFGPKWTLAAGDGFSGGLKAEANASTAEGQTATWKFKATDAGDYEFWARLGWRHWDDHEWRLDGGEWQVSASDGGMYQFIKVPAGPDGKPTEVCWISYGRVNLTAGDHTFEIRIRVPQGKTGAMQHFDCFCLSRTPFVPNGAFRPDEKIPVHPLPGSIATADWWPFQPAYPPDQKPLVDMSFLNEPIEKHGFVTMKDGDLVFGDGATIRFWGTNASYWGGEMIYMEKNDADRFADHLARVGVNCVRIHILHSNNSLMDKTRDDTQHFDPVKLDRLLYLLSALEKRGIYINLDLMYHRTFLPGDNIDPELCTPPANVPKDPNDKYNVSWACGAAAFWHPRAIELNMALYKQLLTTENPYTKKRLIDNPQMAIVNVQNEQSIFWGTTDMRKGHTAELLDQQYTEWLRKKYGTQEKLAAAWLIEGKPSPLAADENVESGVVHVGKVVMSPDGANDKRVLDQKVFLYDVETGFYKKWTEAMRSWGVKCPIITSNWNGGGNTTRLVLQASTIGDVVDRHNYFMKPESMIAAMDRGNGTPLEAFERQAGRAFCISEWNHGTDGLFVPQSVPVMATVAALQDWNALFQFDAEVPTWSTALSGATVPGQTALYPLAALIMRRGDVQSGPLVYERHRDPAYQFGNEKEQRVLSTDPAARATGADAGGATPVPPEVVGIGRVQNSYVEKFTPDTYRQDLVEKCWDKEKGIVTSATGEVEWRYKEDWMRLDTPRTQGAFGAIAGHKVDCKDVTIESPNAQAAVLVSSLDAEPKPLSSATKILVAAVGREQPNAIAANPQDAKAPTAPPCLMEPVKGTVTVKTALKKVTSVSATGYRIGDVPAQSADGKLTFQMGGEAQVVYYVIGAD